MKTMPQSTILVEKHNVSKANLYAVSIKQVLVLSFLILTNNQDSIQKDYPDCRELLKTLTIFSISHPKGLPTLHRAIDNTDYILNGPFKNTTQIA